MANQLLVVDLSHHNAGPFDWRKAEANGLVAVIHKCTEGVNYCDPQYWARRQPVLDAGLKWASYHFLRHGNIRDQMDWYMHNAQPEKGSRACIDYEHADVTLDDLRQAITVLGEIAPSLQLAVYAGHLIKEQLGSTYDPILAQTSLWIAQYTSAEQPSWPQGTWPTWSLWQYSDGSVGGNPKTCPGIKGPTDCNAFNGSAANCAKWIGPSGAEPQPAPPPDDAKVANIAITTSPGVSVMVTVNGDKLT